MLAMITATDFVLVSCSSRGDLSLSPSVADIDAASCGPISPYDQLMRAIGAKENIDWRLLAAIAYQESRFTPEIRSHRGAKGLMQITSKTARAFDTDPDLLNDPAVNITVAVKLLKHIDSSLRFSSSTSPDDRLKITLACYNGGIGHIYDARRLAAKQGANYNSWASLRDYVTMKGTDEWVGDESIRNGSFLGHETVAFVDKVMNTYRKYCENYI